MTVMMPQIPMASPLMAPSVSPISRAFDVPTAWLQAPMASPASRGSFTRKRRTKKGASMLPSVPVMRTATTVTGTTPENRSVMLTAMGVVTDLDSSDSVIF